MNADKAATGAAVLTIIAIPTMLICLGLYLGTSAMRWSPWLALIGAITIYPTRDPGLLLAEKVLGFLAVLGALAWLVS